MSVLDEDFNVSVNYNELYGAAMATWTESMIEVHRGSEAHYLMDAHPITAKHQEAAFDILTHPADTPIETVIARWVYNRFGNDVYGCSVMPVTEVEENKSEDRYIVVLGNDRPGDYAQLSNILITLSKYKYDQ